MDAAGFRVYFGEGPDRVEWPGFRKFSAAVAVADPGAPAAELDGRYDVLTVERVADAATPGFWSWERTANGELARKTLTIDVVDDQGTVASYSFQNAWPTKYAGATVQAGSNETAIESLQIAHEGLSIR